MCVAATRDRVTGDADFNGDLLFSQISHQFRIVDGVKSMPNAMRLQFSQRTPDRLRPNRFSRMDG